MEPKFFEHKLFKDGFKDWFNSQLTSFFTFENTTTVRLSKYSTFDPKTNPFYFVIELLCRSVVSTGHIIFTTLPTLKIDDNFMLRGGDVAYNQNTNLWCELLSNFEFSKSVKYLRIMVKQVFSVDTS